MTVSAQQVWTEYREEVGATNHDGSFTLPENVDDLGDRQRRGWARAAQYANQHTADALTEARRHFRCAECHCKVD